MTRTKAARKTRKTTKRELTPLRKEAAKWLTVDDVAKRYRLSCWSVYRWAKSGRLPSIRVGEKLLRFDARQVERAMKALAT